MNYMEIKFPDSANGSGVRVSLFVSGCTHHCKGCFNPETWSFDAGKPFDSEAKQLIMDHMAKSYVSGLSLLGGEPMEPSNAEALIPFVQEIREKFPNKDVWAWTGYLFENLTDKNQQDLLKLLDFIVDGKFEEVNKKVGLKFRGSSNQRLIDVQTSLSTGSLAEVK